MKKIRVTLGFAAVVCLLGWCDLGLCGWFLLTLLLHELGHLAVLACFHRAIRGITLGAGGAKIETEGLSYRQEVLSAAAGPAANLLSAGLTLRILPVFALVSLALAAVNLLPLYPMDGGRILRASLLSRLPPERAGRILRLCVFLTCTTLMVGACWLTAICQAGLWPIFAALVLLCRAGNAAAEIL